VWLKTDQGFDYDSFLSERSSGLRVTGRDGRCTRLLTKLTPLLAKPTSDLGHRRSSELLLQVKLNTWSRLSGGDLFYVLLPIEVLFITRLPQRNEPLDLETGPRFRSAGVVESQLKFDTCIEEGNMGWLGKLLNGVAGAPPIELIFVPSIPATGVPGIGEEIKPDSCYIELYLESLRLERARKFATRFHGVAYSFVTLPREGDQHAQLTAVSKPEKLAELDKGAVDRVITVSKGVGMVPRGHIRAAVAVGCGEVARCSIGAVVPEGVGEISDGDVGAVVTAGMRVGSSCGVAAIIATGISRCPAAVLELFLPLARAFAPVATL
jgi:hypothetical protein